VAAHLQKIVTVFVRVEMAATLNLTSSYTSIHCSLRNSCSVKKY